MKTRIKGKLLVPAAAVIVATLASAGGSLAYLKAAGSGSGDVSVASAEAVTIGAGMPTAFLSPGARADVAISITNPNSFAVHLASLELGQGGIDVDDAHASDGCSDPDLTFTGDDNGGAGWVVPSGTHVVDLADAIRMGADADDACQGATFTVHLEAGS